MRIVFQFAVCLIGVPCILNGQQWNTESVLDIVARSADRRSADFSGGGLTDYSARAHGYVFFLAQFGDEFGEPRLVKSDQLELEVYWRSPNDSKQRIIGWRDKVDLPTVIRYHRDHLGIIQNNFGDRIRLGEGDEVRDVVHPLSARGPLLYDYAIVDSLAIRIPERTVNVYQIAIRPKNFDLPGVVGTVYLDIDDGAVVRFQFGFTPSSYLDDTLADVTIAIENGLMNARFWLPRRQEIEIRRSSSWLDFPVQGIIRARWEIDGYELNPGLTDSVFRGPEIVSASPQVRDSFPWSEPLETGIAVAVGPALNLDLNEIRSSIRDLAAGRSLSGIKRIRPGVAGISDIIRFNRVQGLALGGGVGFRMDGGGGAGELSAWAGYGFGDGRLKGRFEASRSLGSLRVSLLASRLITDVSEYPIISGVANSLTGQELGRDHGDYSLIDYAGIQAGTQSGGVALSLGVERSRGVSNSVDPASGGFRPNPDLGGPAQAVAEAVVRWRRTGGGTASRSEADLRVRVGSGGGSSYQRLSARLHVHEMVKSVELRAGAWGGWGSAELPLHQNFVIGGWGTLLGEPFHAWGGRWAVTGRLEVGGSVRVPEAGLGSFFTTGRAIYIGAFVSIGGAGGQVPGVPWVSTSGSRETAGVTVEALYRLLKIEVAWSLREGTAGLTIDLNRALWAIL